MKLFFNKMWLPEGSELFIYNDENYGMAYITDGWISRDDITLPTTCKMKRPKKS